jgi:hypothetical protein
MYNINRNWGLKEKHAFTIDYRAHTAGIMAAGIVSFPRARLAHLYRAYYRHNIAHHLATAQGFSPFLIHRHLAR